MGFFFRRLRNGKLLFEVKGDDILYALQFPICEWDYRVYIQLPKYNFKFIDGDEYFLLIEEGIIKCVWEYKDFVPEYPKTININSILKSLNRLGKNVISVDDELKKYSQPTFDRYITCKYGIDTCKSWVHPFWANVLSHLVKKEMNIPVKPYICVECLDDPPRKKKGQCPTPLAIMKNLYG